VSVAPTTDAVAVARDRSRAAGRRGLARRDPGLTLALVLLAVIVLIAVAGPLVWTIDPRHADIGNALLAPSWSHPMGTDGSGRDILARFAAGARISLLAGLAVVAVGALAGIPLGVIAGLGRGLTDNVLMRLLDAILAPSPEWGAMITDGQEQIVTGQWWVAVFPGLGVLLVVVAANVLSDRLRERLDPRATERGR
jgi:peptide/nickel transport system permease protein